MAELFFKDLAPQAFIAFIWAGESRNNNKGIKIKKFGLRVGKEKRGCGHPTITQKALIGNGTWTLTKKSKFYTFFQSHYLIRTLKNAEENDKQNDNNSKKPKHTLPWDKSGVWH